MNQKVSLSFLLSDTRARVYLLWAVLASGGFLLTHFYQREAINLAWILIVMVGLGYMYKVMPLRVRQMKQIYLSWLIPITIGLLVSTLAFRVGFLSGAIQFLGAFWLFVLSFGYLWNGLVDPPAKWYFMAAAANLIFAGLCFGVESFTQAQYIVAAVVSAWSMFSLWIFRSDG